MRNLVSNTFKSDILENAPVIIAYHDLENNIMWANSAYRNATGLSLQEIVGKKCYSVRGLVGPCRNCPVVKTVETGEPAEAELTPENQDRWPKSQGSWLSKSEPMKDENTDRILTEKALQEQTKTLQQTQRVGKIGSWWYDPVTQTFTWTEEMFHIFGLEPQPEAIPYEDHQSIIHPEDWDRFDAAVTRAVTEGIGNNLELRIMQPNGEIRHVETRYVAQKNDDGMMTQLIGTTQDVTERKQGEEERLRLVTAVESAAESIIITNGPGTIQYVNPTFERNSGYTREEIVGQNFRILKSDKHDEAFYRGMYDIISHGQIWSGRIINRMKDGSLREFETSISPIKDNTGKIINFVSVNRDITQEVALESQLRQTQKMEAIGNLAGGIAHDFNNILSSIIGFTELSLDDVEKGTSLEDNLQEVYAASKRAHGK